MPQRILQYIPAFLPEALTASQVGVWETDFGNNITVGDVTTALLFGVDPALASNGLSFEAWVRGIHPADRQAFNNKIGPLRENGGRFVIEYRTCPAAGVVRWVLARGSYELDRQTGSVIGRGIVIDITDSKLDGHVEDRALFVAPIEDEQPLDRVATYALKARHAIDDLGGREASALRLAADALLWSVARALARRMNIQ